MFLLLASVICDSLVLVDAYDSVEYLDIWNTGPPPTRFVWGDENGRLEDNEYPGGDQGVDLSRNKTINGEEKTLAQHIQDEYWSIHSSYGKTSLPDEMKQYHAAAWRNFLVDRNEPWGTEVKRIKARVIVDTYFGRFHCSGLFMPPGEKVTIQIPDIARNKIGIIYNQQVRNFNGYGGTQKRLFATRWETIHLDRQDNDVIWPYGAYLAFDVNPDTFDEPLEIIVGGAVLTPWFRYGVDTDEDWNTKISQYPGLVACFENGNGQFIMPAEKVRDIKNPSLAMRFYRSCAQVMESTCVKSNSYGGTGPRWTGRERVPCYWYFDAYVPAGAACAYIGWLFSCFPLGWIGGCLNGYGAMRGCWGHLHELGHHHQGGWGIGYTGEVTNNVLVVTCYAYYSRISGFRREDGNGGITWSEWPGWEFVTHPFSCMFTNRDICQWVALLHGFGCTKMREFIRSDWKNEYCDKWSIGTTAAYIVRAAHIFGYDIRDHLIWNSYGDDVKQECGEGSECDRLLKNMSVKPFWGVANIYQTGYEVNGTTFETARSWTLQYQEWKVFNFSGYQNSWKRNESFTITTLRPGRGTWKEISYGVYNYTPPLDRPGDVDEWWLTYHESHTDQDVVTYGTIRQEIIGKHFWYRYEDLQEKEALNVTDAYNMTQYWEGKVNRSRGSGIKVDKDSIQDLKSFVTIVKGTLVPPESGKYTFYAKCDERLLFYMSQQPLAYEVEADKEALVLTVDDGKVYENDWAPYHSKEMVLNKGDTWNYCLVLYNHYGNGLAQIGYSLNDGNIKDFPTDNTTYAGISACVSSKNRTDARYQRLRIGHCKQR